MDAAITIVVLMCFVPTFIIYDGECLCVNVCTCKSIQQKIQPCIDHEHKTVIHMLSKQEEYHEE